MLDAKKSSSSTPAAAATGAALGGTPHNKNNGERESSKITLLINRTPGIAVLKTKFLTVLDSSNELLNGISNRLTLSNSSSDTDYLNDDEEDLPKYDETIDYTKIDFEFRRVKARRAHEEIISGRFRYPNLGERFRNENPQSKGKTKSAPHSASSDSDSSNSSSSTSSSLCDAAKAESAADAQSIRSSTTRSQDSIESRNSGGCEKRARAIPGARRSELDLQRDLVQKRRDRHGSSAMHVNKGEVPEITTTLSVLEIPNKSAGGAKISQSSTLTSLRDESDLQASLSVESSDWKNFIRSESENSMPSWASSISLDCRAGGDEAIKDFMQKFIDTLYSNPVAINATLKTEYCSLVRLQIGRQWFTRFIMERKVMSKRIEELTFHALVQYFSILLCECDEFEDFMPATRIMNLCFLFYHEVEVPGCDPYREYLYIFMRQQPIWHTLKFWNTAFLEAIKCENDRRIKKLNAKSSKKLTQPEEQFPREHTEQNLNISAATGQVAAAAGNPSEQLTVAHEYAHLKEDIIFRILGMFVCNMHSLGIPQELCMEFVAKHATQLSVSKEFMKILRQNIQRMYHETELWGAKEN